MGEDRKPKSIMELLNRGKTNERKIKEYMAGIEDITRKKGMQVT